MDLKFTVSSPKIDTTHLPEDQPIHLLHEARDCYSDATPPFAKRNVGNNANGTTKRIVLATIDGKYPQLPTIVESISRRWDEYYTFATVDLNCKRRIVMSLSGGPKGGARYIRKCIKEFNLAHIAHAAYVVSVVAHFPYVMLGFNPCVLIRF